MHNHDHGSKCCCKGHLPAILAAVLLLVVAAMHVLGFILGWSFMVNGMELPSWARIVAIVLSGGIGAWVLCCACCKKCHSANGKGCGTLPK